METFDRGKFVVADYTRGKVMIASFFLAAFTGFLVGLQTSTLIGMLLLFVVLIIAITLVSRAKHDTKKNTDYIIAFFITILAFLGFWIISLNIP